MHNPMDIFEMFFGGHGLRRGNSPPGSSSPRRGRDIMYGLSVTLEELYNGVEKKLPVERGVICDKCQGRGGKEGSAEKCKNCDGAGIQIRTQQFGQGFIQHTQTICPECEGRGETIKAKDRCEQCQGRRVNKQNKEIVFQIEKGMKDGQQIRLSGEGHEHPGVEAAGDLVVVLDEIPHPVFRHYGSSDLIVHLQLELVEALGGFKKTIETLDKRILLITSQPGDVINDGDIRYLQNEGMPQYRNPTTKGRLLVSFAVRFPSKNWMQGRPADLPGRYKQLESLLPPRQTKVIPEGAEQLEMKEFDPNAEPRVQFSEGYDSDEEGAVGHRLQCAQH